MCATAGGLIEGAVAIRGVSVVGNAGARFYWTLSSFFSATGFGIDPRRFFDAGLAGALCDDETKAKLRAIADEYDWPTAQASAAGEVR